MKKVPNAHQEFESVQKAISGLKKVTGKTELNEKTRKKFEKVSAKLKDLSSNPEKHDKKSVSALKEMVRSLVSDLHILEIEMRKKNRLNDQSEFRNAA